MSFRFVAVALSALGICILPFGAHAINEKLAFSRAADGRIVITVTGDSFNVCGEPPPVTAEIFTVEHKIVLLPPTLPHQPILGMIYFGFPPVGRGFECIIGANLRRYSFTLLLPVFPEGVYVTTLRATNLEVAATATVDTRAIAIPTIPTTSSAGIAALLMSIAGIAYLGLRRK